MKRTMNTLSVREFRNNMAASLDKADAGEQVIIRRNDKLYAIAPINTEEPNLSAELQAKIEQARNDYKEGRYVSCTTREQLHTFLDAL